MSDKICYCAGFLFYRATGAEDEVLLVNKTRPTWQSGLLNAVGGKLDGWEHADVGMRREFKEETTVDVEKWKQFCVENGSDYIVYFFHSRWPEHKPRPETPHCNDVGEPLNWMGVSALIDTFSPHKMVGNLRWLVPMALDWRGPCANVTMHGDIKERPTW